MAVSSIGWWQWLPLWSWRIVSTYEAVDEVPQFLPRNGVALVASEGVLKWLVFDCPCRSGHRMMLALQGSPRWTFSSHERLSVSPSVDYRGADRRCHYIIRNGRVKWT